MYLYEHDATKTSLTRYLTFWFWKIIKKAISVLKVGMC